ncbi:M15 family metallopeptidase [uncultured Roseibium sp.]|jgi:D-alanyl-D-alanine dipeptidase|uniref:M15 family metallopeptidase n=1 Tax=uncultured Roseibium sp. TaxID=1936171 RepID=UPI003216F571
MRTILLAGLLSCVLPAHAASPLPDGFVYLRDTVPEIRQDIRYAGQQNFMHRPLAGYRAAECILTEAAANGLRKAARLAKAQGFDLIVFDCYRPARAVRDMADWSAAGAETDAAYFPRTRRDRLIAEGYVGRKSAHARGSTVDLAMVPAGGTDGGRHAPSPCSRHDRHTADFGTAFDCFHPFSRTASKNVSPAAQTARRNLLALMEKAGFRNYPAEWWHFTLKNEPFPRTSFDFPITER